MTVNIHLLLRQAASNRRYADEVSLLWEEHNAEMDALAASYPARALAHLTRVTGRADLSLSSTDQEMRLRVQAGTFRATYTTLDEVIYEVIYEFASEASSTGEDHGSFSAAIKLGRNNYSRVITDEVSHHLALAERQQFLQLQASSPWRRWFGFMSR